jgi:tRNA (guanine-N7-)-methyltransferase
MTQIQPLNSLSLPFPTDWAAVFGADRPLIVEIGFGNGDYLVALAQHYPDHHIIGFEISNPSLMKAQRKAQRHQLHNVRVVYSRAETALHHLFTPQSVRQFHINYPDPWFKARHSGRRLMQRDTLDALVSRLEPDGLLYLATDIRAYAELSHDLLAQTPTLDNQLARAWVHDFPQRLITTKYEEKGYREGRKGHYFKYQRNHQPAPHVPVKEELPVPHVVIQTPMNVADIAQAVTKISHHPAEGFTVAVLSGYYNPTHDSALIEVIIEEPTIEQHIALVLRRKSDDSYTLRYASFGQPRPTAGMHYAVGFVGDWIADLHPDATVTRRSLRTT